MANKGGGIAHSASHPAALGLNPGSVVIYSILLRTWTVEKSNPSSAYARDFVNAVQQRPELRTAKKECAVPFWSSWVYPESIRTEILSLGSQRRYMVQK